MCNLGRLGLVTAALVSAAVSIVSAPFSLGVLAHGDGCSASFVARFLILLCHVQLSPRFEALIVLAAIPASRDDAPVELLMLPTAEAAAVVADPPAGVFRAAQNRAAFWSSITSRANLGVQGHGACQPHLLQSPTTLCLHRHSFRTARFSSLDSNRS